MAGMAQGVNPDTPVALRYQVDWSARRAKLGYTRRSIWPLESSRDFRGNSSNRIITSGGCLPPVTADEAAAAEGSARAGRTSLETGEASRKTRAKTSGAGARYRSHSRSQDVLA